ncbi:glycosyltransferase family 9 protein [Desulfovibrio sp. OttesenSCG-928-O18]|nr:glycosyltransferase family 9 protein [Desulfovibrio sp. OttesenSCG-928-O18]
MNILVINLTRFGDLLQSAAALRALARGHDGKKNRVGLVCLDNFYAGAELLADVADIYPLPAGKIMAALNAPGAEKADTAWLSGVAGLYDWVEKTRGNFSPDKVCNISPTIAACLLGRLLADGRECSGFTLDAFGFMQNSTPWASFMQGATASRGNSPFNIVDLFRKVAGDTGDTPDASLLPPSREAVAAMERQLKEAAPEGCAGFLALQLGASADIRRWPLEFFARAGDTLWERHRLLPLLLGAKSEIPLAEEYASFARQPYYSLAGRTNITELAAALTLSSLCISNDTGTLHLASGLAVPVLGIYLATAQVWDTGPYAIGNCSLEPDLPCHPCDFGRQCENGHACHRAITPETVIRLAEAALQKDAGNTANFAAPATCKGARVWKSTRDAHGFADALSLSGHEDEDRTRWMRIERHLFRQFFDREAGKDFTPDLTHAPQVIRSGKGHELAAACDGVLALFDALLQQGEMLAQNPIPLVMDRFQRTWHRLATLLSSQPDFAAAAFLWRNETMAASGLENALPLVRQYHALFRAFRAFLP